jgi:hypothetical protein
VSARVFSAAKLAVKLVVKLVLVLKRGRQVAGADGGRAAAV